MGDGTARSELAREGNWRFGEDTVRQPIEEAIRQLEAELSLLKTWLPNRGSAHSLGKSGGVAKTLSRKQQPPVAGQGPSKTSLTKPKAEV